MKLNRKEKGKFHTGYFNGGSNNIMSVCVFNGGNRSNNIMSVCVFNGGNRSNNIMSVCVFNGGNRSNNIMSVCVCFQWRKHYIATIL